MMISVVSGGVAGGHGLPGRVDSAPPGTGHERVVTGIPVSGTALIVLLQFLEVWSAVRWQSLVHIGSHLLVVASETNSLDFGAWRYRLVGPEYPGARQFATAVRARSMTTWGMTGAIVAHDGDTARFGVHLAMGDGDGVWLEWTLHFVMRGRGQPIAGATRLCFGAQGRVAERRDYWDLAQDLYEKLPLMRALPRRLAAAT